MTKTIKDDREVRTKPSAVTQCPKCGKKVTLIEETEEWTQRRDGSWRHFSYGPGTGECCGLAFLDDPWEGLKVFCLEAK